MAAILVVILLAIVALAVVSFALHVLFSPWLLLAGIGILLLVKFPPAPLAPVAGHGPGPDRKIPGRAPLCLPSVLMPRPSVLVPAVSSRAGRQLSTLANIPGS